MTARTATLLAPWLGLCALLLVPLVAMRLTDEVAWTPGDFLAALLLFGTPLALWQLVSPRLSGTLPRALLALALLGATALAFGTLALSD